MKNKKKKKTAEKNKNSTHNSSKFTKNTDFVNRKQQKKIKILKIIPIIPTSIAIIQRQPFTTAIMLTITSIIVAINISTNNSNPWMIALLILTYTRGIIIILIYLSSLTTRFFLKTKTRWLTLIILLIIIPTEKKQQTIQITTETFNSIVPNILGIVILLALFVLSSIAFQPQKTIQITLYEKKHNKNKPNNQNCNKFPSRFTNTKKN